MTTLQEKAEEYAKRECGYNIDCDTAVSCAGCQWLDNSITENQMRNSSKGFIAGYQAAKYEDRWRSVDDELPELCVPVLVKRNPDVFGADPTEHQLCYLGKYDDGEIAWFQCEIELSACRITHWKPIEL